MQNLVVQNLPTAAVLNSIRSMAQNENVTKRNTSKDASKARNPQGQNDAKNFGASVNKDLLLNCHPEKSDSPGAAG